MATKEFKQLCLGVLAHVDAGKTTLNEAFLYHGGIIRKLGRVDHSDSYFDFDNQEKSRGITIFSKTAVIEVNNTKITLLDTPGHVDFSSEMERVLQVLDMAILVINGIDGVQSHTLTIYNLLKQYDLPFFVFVNKMDITTKTKDELLDDLCSNLDKNCVDFSTYDTAIYEKCAMNDELLLNEYLETEQISKEHMTLAINNKKVIPVYFGSALKDDGVTALLEGIDKYSLEVQYPKDFGMRIFKVAYDQDGTRLVYGKITGGSLNAKQRLSEDEKIDQIRILSGNKYTIVQQANAGEVVALKGLNGYVAGQGLGFEKDVTVPVLEGYLNYRVKLPYGCDSNMMLRQLMMLQQEDPQINVNYDEQLKEIHVLLMGEIQIEVLTNIIKNRTGVDVEFTDGKVLFKETIDDVVDGYGHFEPLRHYAEVHVRLEPLPRGSGLEFDSEVSTDELSLNWQRLILTHMKEKRHRGVLTGSQIDDIRIVLTAGRAHLKHTEGGDFRQATYRAIRQGLKMANSVLLEPFYNFTIVVSKSYLSRVLYDLDTVKAKYVIEEDENGNCIISGKGSVRKMNHYAITLASLTSGSGKISLALAGYDKCEDASEVILQRNYDSETDFYNPTGSVFCAHGSGFYVPYNYVEQYIHIKKDSYSSDGDTGYYGGDYSYSSNSNSTNKYSISDEQLKQVVASINGRNRKEKVHGRDKKRETAPVKKERSNVSIVSMKDKYIIVDGYNMMFGWEKTKGMPYDNAREVVINDMASYAGFKNVKLTVVFDAYKSNENIERVIKSGIIEVVYTKKGQTADTYIEKLVGDNRNKYDIYVASSDGAVQNMIFAMGAKRISARELEKELEYLNGGYFK